MIFESLFHGFMLGGNASQKKTAELKMNQMINNTDSMRRDFFANSRKWQEDKFTLFGEAGTTRGEDFQWTAALEKLTLLEEGYYPFALTFELPITDAALEKSKLKGFQYKTVITSSCRRRAVLS